MWQNYDWDKARYWLAVDRWRRLGQRRIGIGNRKQVDAVERDLM